MNKLRLKADIIDLGVADDSDVIIIYELPESLYITIVSRIDVVKKFYYQKGELIFIGGNQVAPGDVDLMKKLEVY